MAQGTFSCRFNSVDILHFTPGFHFELKPCPLADFGATLKAGMTERWNHGMAESQKGGKSPQILKEGIAESERRKIPPNLKRRNRRITEQQKIPPNLKRRNHGKSTEILKDGIM